MKDFQPKKLLILKILEILTEFSDCNHKLRQKDILSLLNIQYGVECERKAIARNIEFLQMSGYNIVSDKDGVYLASKKFELGELRLLIDSVLSNRNICKRHTTELIKKLSSEGGKYFKNHVKHVVNLDDWQKDKSSYFFYNIEMLCEAIEKKVKITFFYSSYDVDKKLHTKRTRKTLANAYQLFLKNGRYYLVCNYQGYNNILFIRVDKMLDLELTDIPAMPINTIKGYENGLNLGKLSNGLPYLFEDSLERVEFVSTSHTANIVDNVIDCFGNNMDIVKLPDNNYKFSVLASPRAMRFWILQFGKYIKVISPQSLVEQIKKDVEEMVKLYDN